MEDNKEESESANEIESKEEKIDKPVVGNFSIIICAFFTK